MGHAFISSVAFRGSQCRPMMPFPSRRDFCPAESSWSNAQPLSLYSNSGQWPLPRRSAGCTPFPNLGYQVVLSAEGSTCRIASVRYTRVPLTPRDHEQVGSKSPACFVSLSPILRDSQLNCNNEKAPPSSKVRVAQYLTRTTGLAHECQNSGAPPANPGHSLPLCINRPVHPAGKRFHGPSQKPPAPLAALPP